MPGNMFDQIDFGPLKEYLTNDDITDISYSNNGQIHLKTLFPEESLTAKTSTS